jgi:acetoin utilization deacetylase AcuC-like enzyme
MKIIFSKKCLEYEFPGHPESPKRVELIYQTLRGAGYEFIEPEQAKKEDILLVHTEELYDKVKNKNYFDFDTPTIDINYPLLSVGGAILGSQLGGFSITRPPGHHAGKNFLGGFCYFNNIAIATEKLGKRAVILDLDVHHGNGTQDIFLGRNNVLYISIHQENIFPGTGCISTANCLNYPLPAGTSERLYLKTLEKALEEKNKFKPEILAISIGFDTYHKERLANFKLKKESYRKIGELIKKNLSEKIFIVLEGGYTEDIGILCLEFLKGLEL